MSKHPRTFTRLFNLSKTCHKFTNEVFLNRPPSYPAAYISRNVHIGKSNQNRSLIYKLGLAVGVGLVVGGSYETIKIKNLVGIQPKNSKDEDEADYGKLNPPEIKPTRHVSGPLNDLDLTFTLFQFESCPFCCKVRAFLEYYGVPFNIVEVHPLLKRELNFSKEKKVPLLLVSRNDECEVITESSVVISVVGTFLLNPESGFKDAMEKYKPIEYIDEKGKKIKEVADTYFLKFGEEPADRTYEEMKEEREWRRWVDKDLVHLISPNVYRTLPEATETFHRFSDRGHWDIIFTSWERNLAIYSGSFVMYLIGKRLASKHKLDKDVRKSLYSASRKWTKAIGEDRKFLGGKLPNLGDLAVYGVLNSMEGCRAFEDMVRETKIGPWYNEMKIYIAQHAGSVQVPAKRAKNEKT